MARLATALAVFAAGVTVTLTHHDRPAQTLNLSAPEPQPHRASRGQLRKPLAPNVKAASTRQGATPHRKRAPARSGPSRPAFGGQRLDITAYCATGHLTASGKTPRVGMAAGNRWPFGTVLRIAGYGDVTIEDRIGWGSDVDLFFGDDAGCEARASAFGRQHRLVVAR